MLAGWCVFAAHHRHPPFRRIRHRRPQHVAHGHCSRHAEASQRSFSLPSCGFAGGGSSWPSRVHPRHVWRPARAARPAGAASHRTPTKQGPYATGLAKRPPVPTTPIAAQGERAAVSTTGPWPPVLPAHLMAPFLPTCRNGLCPDCMRRGSTSCGPCRVRNGLAI